MSKKDVEYVMVTTVATIRKRYFIPSDQVPTKGDLKIALGMIERVDTPVQAIMELQLGEHVFDYEGISEENLMLILDEDRFDKDVVTKSDKIALIRYAQ
jgi:hypothetical protein|tara:strand:- start:1052 stop:1348 length:297 start_codon:yes stop_codon:yes gene_type:complete